MQNPDVEFAVILFGFIIIYLLPSIIAIIRKHKNLVPVLIINIFLGATFFGWVIALAWALTADAKKIQKKILKNESSNYNFR